MTDPVLQQLMNERNAIGGMAASAVGDDPDEAAQAMDLESSTGVPAGAIYGDDGEFQRRRQRQLAQEIVGNNSYLHEWFAKNPMHARVSNDDLGNLDKVSESWDKLHASSTRPWSDVLLNSIAKSVQQNVSNVIDLAGSSFGQESWKNIATKMREMKQNNLTEAEQQMFWAQVGSIAGGLITALPAIGVSPVAGGAVGFGLLGAGSQFRAAEEAGAEPLTKAGAAAAGGVLGAAVGAMQLGYLGLAGGGIIKQAATQAAFFPAVGEVQEVIDKFIARNLYDPEAHWNFDANRLAAGAFVGGTLGAAHGMWFRAGKNTPPGVDKNTDIAYKEQAQENKENLQELQKAASASLTAERSEQAFRAYLDEHPEATVRISADGLRKIYGDTSPEAGDGKLGDFVGPLAHEAALATDTGVSIPLKDWLTRVPEKLRDDIIDDLVLSKGGISVNEGKDLPEPLPPEEPLEDDELARLGVDKEVIKRLRQLDKQQNPWAQLERSQLLQDIPLTVLQAVEDAVAARPLKVKPPAEVPEGEPADMPPNLEAKITEARIRGAFTKKDWDFFQSAAFRYQQVKAEFLNRINERLIRKKQTDEWKAAALAAKADAEKAVQGMPLVAADDLLRYGKMYGVQLNPRPKIDPAELTPEQRKVIDPEYLSRRGVHPDIIAKRIGYESGEAMLRDLAEAAEARRQSGDGPQRWRSRIVDAEITDRLQRQFGTLEENILAEVLEHMISPGMMDRIHSEVQLLGKLAGEAEPSIQGEGLKEWVKNRLDQLRAGDETLDDRLAAAGKSGRRAEQAWQKGDMLEAYKQKQMQYLNLQFANQIKRLEVAKARVDRNLERFKDREVTDFPVEHTNRIHEVMFKIGEPPKRSMEDLAKEIQASKTPGPIADWAKARWDKGSEMDISDFLLDPNFETGNRNNLTVEQFHELDQSLRDMIADGNAQRKVTDGAKRVAIEDAMEELRAEIRGAKPELMTERREEALIPKLWRGVMAQSLALHSIFTRIGAGDPKSAFVRMFVLPGIEADGINRKTGEEIGKRHGAILKKYKITDRFLNKIIDNDLFLDNASAQPGLPLKPVKMTKGGHLAILAYLGEHTAWDKLTRGWNVDPVLAEQWAMKHATEKDLDMMQEIGAIWDDLKGRSDKTLRADGFVPAENLVKREISAFGRTWDGWYTPINKSPKYKFPPGQDGKAQMTPADAASLDALFNEDYIRAHFGGRWQKQRTGDARPTNLDFNDNLKYMGAMIRDIAYRPYLNQLSKFMYDARFRQEIERRFGPEFGKQLDPFMKALTNQDNPAMGRNEALNKASEYLRTGLVSFYIAYKGTTLAKHVPSLAMNSITQVGGLPYLREAFRLFGKDLGTGETNSKFYIDNSYELGGRANHYGQTLTGNTDIALGRKGLREQLMYWAGTPLAIGDIMSARPQWGANYREAMTRLSAENPGVDPAKNHQQAVLEADYALRRSHGSVGLTNRPTIVRNQSAAAKWITSFYGVFSHFLDRNYELTWRVADQARQTNKAFGEAVSQRDVTLLKNAIDGGELKKISALLFSYVLFPTFIGALVDGEIGKELEDDDPDFSDYFSAAVTGTAKEIPFFYAGMFPGARDVFHGIKTGKGLEASLLSSEYSVWAKPFASVPKFGADVWENGLAEADAKRALWDLSRLVGATWQPGLLGDQSTKTMKFMYNWLVEEQEEVEGLGSLLHGMAVGTNVPPKRRR